MSSALKTSPIQQIGAYKIERKIGEGATADVYLANKSDRLFAIKLMKLFPAEEASAAALRFRKESAALARLNHPNLVKVFELGEFENRPFVAMEYIEGVSLAELLAQGPLAQEKVVLIGQQIAGALTEVHRKSLLHQDIKSENILIEKNGQARLIDFGFVETDQNSSDEKVIGTLLYSPPERVQGDGRTLDARSDLYSLGVALYQSLTGRLPFTAESAAALAEQILSTAPKSPLELQPAVSPSLSMIIYKLISKDPNDRYSSAVSLSEDLAQLTQFDSDLAAGKKITLEKNKRVLNRQGQILQGRDSELNLLQETFKSVQEKNGKIVAIQGEPGSGKSYLIQSFLSGIDPKEIILLSAKCQEVDKTPFAALREAIDTYINKLMRSDAATKAEGLELLGQAAKQSDYFITRLSSTLARALDIDDTKIQAQNISPERFFMIIAQFFLDLSTQKKKLVFYIDDVQWLDESSTKVFLNLLPRVAQNHTLIVATARNDDKSQKQTLRLLEGLDTIHCKVLALKSLTHQDVDQLAQAYLGAAVDREMVEQLMLKTHGNPFSIGQFLTAMLDSNVLRLVDNLWTIEPEKFKELFVSLDVVQIILSRVTSLGKEASLILRAAGVIGVAFDLPLLKSVTQLSEEKLRLALNEAVDAHLLEKNFSDDYSIVHDRVREALVQKIDPKELKDIHQSIAVSLDSNSNTVSDDWVRIAFHYGHGHIDQKPERVFEVALSAGQATLKNFANEQAIDTLLIAKKAALLFQAQKKNNSFALYESLGLAYSRVGNNPEAIPHFEEAIKSTEKPFLQARIRSHLCHMYINENLGDLGLQEVVKGLSLLGHRPYTNKFLALFSEKFNWALLFVLKKLGRLFVHSRNLDERKILAELYSTATFSAYVSFNDSLTRQLTPKMLVQLHLLGDRPEIVEGLSFYGLYAGANGWRKESEAAAQKCIEISNVAKNKSLLAISTYNYGLSLHWAGDPFRAETVERDFLDQHAKWLVPRRTIAISLDLSANNLLVRGYMSEAIRTIHVGIRRAEEAKSPSGIAVTKSCLAACNAVMGRNEEANNLIEESIKTVTQIPRAKADWCWVLAHRLLICLESESWDQAEPFIEKFNSLNIPPATSPFYFRVSFLYVAYIRLHQYCNSGTENENRNFQNLQVALKNLSAAATIPHWRCHLSIIEAAIAYHKKQHSKALDLLAQAEKLAQSSDAAWALYEIAKYRALIFEAYDQKMQSKNQALIAHALAFEYGWSQRMQILEKRFPILQNKRLDPTAAGVTDDTQAHENATLKTQLKALLEISLATHQQFDPDAQAAIVLNEIIRVMGSERAYLFLARDGANLKFAGGRDSNGQALNEPTGYSSTVVHKAFTSRQAVVVAGTEEGELLDSKSAVAFDLRSIMSVPIILKDKAIGVVYVDSRLAKGLFTKDDIQIFSTLANYIGIAIATADAARLEAAQKAAEKEIEIGAAVQALFLPEENEYAGKNLKSVSYYHPAQKCGGDWWYKIMREGSVIFLLGDVTGHGIGPAMITASVGSIIQLLAKDEKKSLKEILAIVNEELFRVSKGQYFISMIAVEIDFNKNTMTAWRVGAPYICIIKPNKELNEVSYPGFLLGANATLKAEAEQVQLEPGDRILLYTDGLLEQATPQGREIGWRGYKKIITETVKQDLHVVRKRISEHFNTARADIPQYDDVTFLLIDYKKQD